MRDCKKNQRNMYYALYSDKIPIVDEFGNEELEYKTGYENPVEFKASLSTGQSNAEESPFGTNVSYDRVISTSNTKLPIDENTLIWYKNKPIFNTDGSVNPDSADYEVCALPLDGLNSLRIAIKKRSKTVVEEVTTKDDTISNSSNNDDDGF